MPRSIEHNPLNVMQLPKSYMMTMMILYGKERNERKPARLLVRSHKSERTQFSSFSVPEFFSDFRGN